MAQKTIIEFDYFEFQIEQKALRYELEGDVPSNLIIDQNGKISGIIQPFYYQPSITNISKPIQVNIDGSNFKEVLGIQKYTFNFTVNCYLENDVVKIPMSIDVYRNQDLASLEYFSGWFRTGKSEWRNRIKKHEIITNGKVYNHNNFNEFAKEHLHLNPSLLEL